MDGAAATLLGRHGPRREAPEPLAHRVYAEPCGLVIHAFLRHSGVTPAKFGIDRTVGPEAAG